MGSPDAGTAPPCAPGMRGWAGLALRLPELHAGSDAAAAAELSTALEALSAPRRARLARLSGGDARLAALDVLMVEAFARCRGLGLTSPARRVMDAAAEAVAARLDVPPILTYGLYIRSNPIALGSTRRFTPAAAEFRFIRMHRLIEDRLDSIADTLEPMLAGRLEVEALAGALPGLGADWRLINRAMAAFRSPARMSREAFVDGFRPYFAGKGAGGDTLEGPSGLQSPSFRAVALLYGYEDPSFDEHTTRVAAYHEPEARARLERARRMRDDGRSLAGLDRRLSGGRMPHLHPDYARHMPALKRAAQSRGYLASATTETLRRLGANVGRWPPREPAPARPVPDVEDLDAGPALRLALGAAAELESALFAFHLEHVATTAHHIGYQRGTGGTAGVDFLLTATFRRALPAAWHSGLAESLLEHA